MAASAGPLLFAYHPLPMWIMDPEDGRVLDVNRAATLHYGIAPQQFLNLRHADLLAEGQARDPSASPLPRDGDTVWHRLADGGRALMLLSISPLPTGSKAPCLVMARDVTRQRRESELLRETLAEVHRLQEWAWHGREVAEQAQVELQVLSRGLIELQERERRGIARELHDEIGQSLSAIRVQFAKLRRRVEGTELLDLIDAAALMTEETLGRVRNLSLMLHPPQLETLGLEAALRWQVDEVARLHGLGIAFKAGRIEKQVNADMAIAVYRIVQEALTNVVRHAGASHVWVDLHSDMQALHVGISDDGVGFVLADVKLRWEDEPSLGLIGMQERARQLGGELTIWSRPGQGTRIAASLPWR